MLLELEKSKTIVETDNLIPVGEGKDGTVYKYNNKIIKRNVSGYMTEEKIIDLREAIPEQENIRLIPPIEIASTLTPKRKSKINIADGYTSKFINENPNFILMKETDSFIEEMYLLRNQIKEYMSKNQIAILDSNPNNLLVSLDDNAIYLIDHDRNVTPSCMHFEKARIKNQDYIAHNDRKLALLMYKALLLQIVKFNGIKFSSLGDPVISYVDSQTERTDITYKNVEDVLKGFKTISEYTKETIRQIKRR